jgi:hypothetical protein
MPRRAERSINRQEITTLHHLAQSPMHSFHPIKIRKLH